MPWSKNRQVNWVNWAFLIFQNYQVSPAVCWTGKSMFLAAGQSDLRPVKRG
jgi:hypothetical protein